MAKKNDTGDAPDKNKDYETAMKNLKGFIKSGNDVEDTKFITTGHFALDLAIAHGVSPDNTEFDVSNLDPDDIGGLPQGRLIELFGAEGSGKSSLAYRVVGYAQKKGLKCLWIDAEQSYSDDLARINDVDTSKIAVADLMDLEDPDHVFSAEEIFDRITDACRADFKVIVLDSVAGLTTQAELDNYIADGGVGMGNLAQLLAKAIKKVAQYAAKYGVTVILINQLREKIGVLFGNPETTPGGRALKHGCSVRIKVQKQSGKDGQVRVQDDNGNDNLIAHYCYVYIPKNRHGKPVEGQIKIPIYYERHFPDMEDILFDTARTLKLIRPRVGVFSWGEFKVTGRRNFIAELKAQNLVDKLVTEVKEAAAEVKFILPPEVTNYKTETEKAEVTVDGRDEQEKVKVPRSRKGKDSSGEPSEPVG